MKKLLMMAACIGMMFAASCTGSKYETVPNDPLNTQIYTLKNGLKVYMSVMKEQPRIQTYIAVKVGGKNDPKETTGLAHYFEHLMFKGTPNYGTSNYEAEKPLLDEIERLFEVYRQTTDENERQKIYHAIDSVSYEASKFSIPNEYDKLMALIGAKGTNAYTGQDMTVYVEDIPSNQIDNWAKIQADRFRTPVIRGFHTELETIYEEKNMSLTQDSRKIWTALDEALFPHHPYGTQTVLGTQEHLKNPSITNVKKYHDTYYVPNNMAICVSGDFDPDEMVAAIEKYFGDMKPNENLPKLQFETEPKIESPIEREVFGLEAENLMIAWRLPKATDASNDVAQVAKAVLYNGQAGLIDLDLNQQQKTLTTYAGVATQPDYGRFLVGAYPNQGQTLAEVRDLALAEVAKLRAGDFDEELVKASINNFKKYVISMLDDYEQRADFYVENFINGGDLSEAIHTLDRIEKITKQDVVDWANEYLGEKNYVVILKRKGVDPNEQKIAAPKITPIVMNRDMESDFLKEVKQSEVKPIEPVFVDYDKDMAQFELRNGVRVLYKQNVSNDLYQFDARFNLGTMDCPALDMASSYIDYLGTETMSAEERALKLYSLANDDFSISSSAYTSWITLSGLSESMAQTLDIMDDLIYHAEADDDILENIKAQTFKMRADAKLKQSANFSALRRYMTLGGEAVRQRSLTNKQLDALSSKELLEVIASLKNYQHEILYYGPMSQDELKQTLEEHYKTNEDLKPLEEHFAKTVSTDKPVVYLVQYDAKQLYYYQFCNYGIPYDVKNDPETMLYNEYFGGGMNSIVFQEMRESRGLAYSAQASLTTPAHKQDTYGYMAFIATQNDKMKTAIEAFDEIINQMPESDAAFQIAKDGLISRLRTDRTVKNEVLWSYLNIRNRGLKHERMQAVFDKVQTMTLDDVKATQQKWVKDQHYIYGILGDIKDLDLNYLKTLGDIKTLSQEDIFGY